MPPCPREARLPDLLERIDLELLPQLSLRSIQPHNPVRVEAIPAPWQVLGSGNYAAALLHPHHPALVVKVYAPGRPGLEQEAEVYRRIGRHRAYSHCFHVGRGFLVLQRLPGITLYDCLRRGVPIPAQVIADVDAALVHARQRGMQGNDVHGRNVLLHRGRGLIVDISDFLNPEPCTAWRDLRWAYFRFYLPLILPLGLRAPAPVLDALRHGYRLHRRLRRWWRRRCPQPDRGLA